MRTVAPEGGNCYKENMIPLLIAFTIKHFVCDFLLQRRYHYANKGVYGHPGGIMHAGIHGIGTIMICWYFGLPLWLAGADAIIHYHIDWAKVNIGKRYGLTPQQDAFWYLLGFDQTLHYLTYVWIISYI
jgi:hypothetical protein